MKAEYFVHVQTTIKWKEATRSFGIDSNRKKLIEVSKNWKIHRTSFFINSLVPHFTSVHLIVPLIVIVSLCVPIFFSFLFLVFYFLSSLLFVQRVPCCFPISPIECHSTFRSFSACWTNDMSGMHTFTRKWAREIKIL